MADDLHRFLRSEPILARRTRWPGHAWRWCRRNPLPASLSALSVFLLLTLVIGSAISSLRLSEQHQATIAQLGVTQIAEAEAVKQERDARHQLLNALVAQSEARRLSGRMGQKFENAASLEQAAELAGNLKLRAEELRALRREVIATMALTDLRIEHEWEGYSTSTSTSGIAFDREVERYAMIDPEGRIVLRRIVDNALLTRIETNPPQSRNSDWRLNLRISPDGRFIAGGHTETPPHEYGLPTRVWDLRTSELLITVDEPAPRSGSFDFSPDGRWFAAGCNDGSIVLFDLQTGAHLRTIQSGVFPYTLRFSPDGERIAIGHPRGLTVVSSESNADRQMFEHPGPVLSVAWDVTGQRVATGTGAADDHAYVRDAGTGRQLTACRHSSDVLHVDFSPDGRRLATTSWKDTRIWDAATGRELLIAPGNVGAFSHDGRWLELGHVGGSVGRWEVAAPEGFRLLPERTAPDAPGLSVSPDGRLLVTTDRNRLLCWELPSGELLDSIPLPHSGPFLRVGFDPTGPNLVTSCRGGIHIWPITTPESGEADQSQAVKIGPPERISYRFDRQITGLVTSDDGCALVADGLYVSLVDLHAPDSPGPRFRDSGWGMASSQDGRWIATSSWHGYETHVWSRSSGHRVATFDGRSARVAFSPDDRWLWVSTADGYFVHETGTWRQRHTVPSQEIKDIWPIAFCDHIQATAIAPDGVVRLLDASTFEELATFLPPTEERVASLAFDPAGRHLCAKTSGGAIHVWIC